MGVTVGGLKNQIDRSTAVQGCIQLTLLSLRGMSGERTEERGIK
jgi:hypothetical protein